MKDLIVKVAFSEDHVVMFGNSYKPWATQLDEYLFILRRDGNYPSGVLSVRVSDSPWVKWGGLKWCQESLFQYQLNREGCQDKDPDNPNPRKYSEMVFNENGAVTKKVKEMLGNVLAGIY
ncbi:spore protein H [Brevibacillus sp. NPDC058079]|uniref:spore protein H n=1 Tax=Brevibacillus sp. NPDC058079 TaxID=3346330 RepID=UPI0036EA885D